MDNRNKREYVKQIFNSISKTYDVLNHLLSFGIDIYWRKKAIKNIYFNDNSVCLDLASGTGDFGIEVFKRNGIKIIGYDLAINSLKLFKGKIKNHQSFSFINGEAEKLCVRNNCIDMVTIAFGIRNFYDTQIALNEIFRVLKPNGILNILEFSLPKNILVRKIYLLYFNFILPTVGKIISKNKTAYNYLPSSVELWDKKDNLVSECLCAGFRNFSVRNFTFGIVKNYIVLK